MGGDNYNYAANYKISLSSHADKSDLSDSY